MPATVVRKGARAEASTKPLAACLHGARHTAALISVCSTMPGAATAMNSNSSDQARFGSRHCEVTETMRET